MVANYGGFYRSAPAPRQHGIHDPRLAPLPLLLPLLLLLLLLLLRPHLLLPLLQGGVKEEGGREEEEGGGGQFYSDVKSYHSLSATVMVPFLTSVLDVMLCLKPPEVRVAGAHHHRPHGGMPFVPSPARPHPRPTV